MAGGLRYETGRDMPPGMAEKVAVQLARQLEAAAMKKGSDNTPVAENAICTVDAVHGSQMREGEDRLWNT